MAKTKTPLTYNELAVQVAGLPLEDKLALFQDLKEDIDAEQKSLSEKLNAITEAKSKVNGGKP